MYIYVIILIEKYAGIIIVSDCTDEPRKAESCLQFKMKKHHIKTWKISHNYKYIYVFIWDIVIAAQVIAENQS